MATTAKEFFKVGERVRMSSYAQKELYPNGLQDIGDIRGIVVDFDFHNLNTLRVRRDSKDRVESFDFRQWEKE